MDPTLPALAELAAQRRAELTVGCVELLTIGLLTQALASASGAAEWFRGGLVGAHPRHLRSVLDVSDGPVVEESTAARLAQGVAQLLGADVGLSTVGVEGPDDHEGREAGTVIIGWSVLGQSAAETLRFPGDPHSVRLRATRAALARLAAAVVER